MTDKATPPRRSTFRLGTMTFVVLGGAGIIVLGLLLGTLVFRANPISTLVGTGLGEIHTVDNEVYVGTILEERNGYVLVGAPAKIVADPGSDTAAPRLLVQMLAVDPYDLAGTILMRADKIVLMGRVAPGSGLEAAYRDATGEGSPTPSPAQ